MGKVTLVPNLSCLFSEGTILNTIKFNMLNFKIKTQSFNLHNNITIRRIVTITIIYHLLLLLFIFN